MFIVLFVLILSVFVIGIIEFVIVGLVLIIVQDLGVILFFVGFLVSLYVLGVVVGVFVFIVLMGCWNWKWVLLFLMSLFIVGNLFVWMVLNYVLFMIVCILIGFVYGVFFLIGLIIVISLVLKDKEVSVIVIMFIGLMVVLVIGVLLGMFIG